MALEKSLKILIVDDDKNICDLLRLYLEKDGYSVILSHDGEEAVVKFNALKPDMVLLDIMLPGIDGWQVCREIRKKSNVPIIMITAKARLSTRSSVSSLALTIISLSPLTLKRLSLVSMRSLAVSEISIPSLRCVK